jgi:hypothetical protein
MSEDLSDRLDRLAGEWTGAVTPARPERVRARGRHRKQRRAASVALLAVAALAAVAVPALRGGPLTGEAVAPAGPPSTLLTAPPAARAELRLRISDPPAGMPAEVRMTGVDCRVVPGSGLSVFGTFRVGDYSGNAEVHPADNPSIEGSGIPGPLATLQFPARPGQLDGDVVVIWGDEVTITREDPAGRRGSMTGHHAPVDRATERFGPRGAGQLALSWWCPPA